MIYIYNYFKRKCKLYSNRKGSNNIKKYITFSWTRLDEPSCFGMANPLQCNTIVINKQILNKISIVEKGNSNPICRYNTLHKDFRQGVRYQEKRKLYLSVISPTQIPIKVMFFICTLAEKRDWRHLFSRRRFFFNVKNHGTCEGNQPCKTACRSMTPRCCIWEVDKIWSQYN